MIALPIITSAIFVACAMFSFVHTAIYSKGLLLKVVAFIGALSGLVAINSL